MKCINNSLKDKRILAIFLTLCLLFSFTACGKKSNASYNVYKTTDELRISSSYDAKSNIQLMGQNLCTPTDQNSEQEAANDIGTSKSAAVFDITDNKVLYSYNMLDQVYPASTTKVMTALIAFKYGNLDQEVTVGDDILNLETGSSVAHLNPGDVLTLRQLIYGLMLPSGNDAAIAIADAVGGSVDGFADMMNKEALQLGATQTHYVNANGLHDESHYTTVYDMYLIFQEACKYDEFVQVISSLSYNAYYRNGSGAAVQNTWTNSCRYINGKKKSPEGVSVIGGKTGTTGEAKYCLVLLSTSSNGHQLISLVYGADTVYNLYLDMNEILSSSQAKLIGQ